MNHHLSIAVHGAAGRMGRRVVAAVAADAETSLVAAIDHPDHPDGGTDAGTLAGVHPAGVNVGADWPATADAVIDFSLPGAIDGVLSAAAKRSIPLVIATTGFDELQRGHIERASKDLPIVLAPSMSTAVNVAMKTAVDIMRSLSNVAGGVDVEIIERHHRFKADAPSGTALRFGELVSGAMGGDVKEVHGRHGETGRRPRNEIGYHAVRVGDDFGRHTIVFGMMGERIELDVAASSRDAYATGSVAAAKWLAGKPAGLYTMFDVLGLND